MKRLLARLLQRRNLYVACFATGLALLLVSGLLAAPFAAAPREIRAQGLGDALYHYHLSAVASTTVSALVLLLLGGFSLVSAGWSSFGRMCRDLVLYDLAAVACGVAAALGLGWMKEIFDALGGRFLDVGDLSADYSGVFAQAVIALLLLVPFHGFVALVGDAFRVRLLALLAPPQVKATAVRLVPLARQMDEGLRQAGAEKDRLRLLDREVRRLGALFAGLDEEAQRSSAGEELMARLRAHEEEGLRIRVRLQALERENAKLREEAGRLRGALARAPEGRFFLAELDDIARRSGEAAACIARESAAADHLADSIRHALPVPPVAEIPAGAEAPAAEKVEPTENDTESTERFAADPEARTAASVKPETPPAPSGSNSASSADTPAPALGAPAARGVAERGEFRSGARAESYASMEAALELLRRKVLIVDDTPEMCKVYSVALAKTGLIEVRTALDAYEAIRLLHSGKWIPDLVMLDIMMPRFSGTELFAAFQRNARLRRIPVIFCSAKHRNAVPEIDKLAPLAYLEKPVSVKKYRAAVFGALGLRFPEEEGADETA